MVTRLPACYLDGSMFFFLVWGTMARAESQGVVADLCPYCCEVRAFEVKDIYRVHHIYYVRLGRGTFVVRTRQCYGCRRQLAFDESKYVGPVANAEAQTLPIGHTLARTNPRLAHRIEELARLEEMATATAYRDQGGDGRMLECVQWLRWLSSASVNEETVHRVAGWSGLGEDERNELLWALRGAGARLRESL